MSKPVKAAQFFLDLEQLKEYVEKFYGNGMDDLEIPEKRRLENYDHFIVQFIMEGNMIIEEVWGCIPQKYAVYGERLAHFEYEKLEWIQDALIWLKEKDIPFSIYEYER
jgi:hypothetical protein